MLTLSEQILRENLKVVRSTGKELYCICPKCGHGEFGVSLKEGNPFGCFRKKKCGYSGNSYELARLFNIEIFKNVASKIDGLKVDFFDGQDIDHSLMYASDMPLPAGYKRIAFHPYLESRGFQEKDYYTYECGVSSLIYSLKKRIIFPIKDIDARVCGYLARSVDSNEELRYLYQSGADYANLLYGLDAYSGQKSALICEGIFDKISLDRNVVSHSRKDSICLSTFSHRLSPMQAIKLMAIGVENLYLWYDLDLYGKTLDIAKKYHNYFNIYIPKFTDTQLDPAEMNESQLAEVESSYELYSPAEYSYINAKVEIY